MWKHGFSYTSAPAKVTMLISVDACLQTIRNLSQRQNTAISRQNLNDQYGVGEKVNFQPVNTGRGAHLPLEANWDRLIFCCVGIATPPPQRACYLPSIAGVIYCRVLVKKYPGCLLNSPEVHWLSSNLS